MLCNMTDPHTEWEENMIDENPPPPQKRNSIKPCEVGFQNKEKHIL